MGDKVKMFRKALLTTAAAIAMFALSSVARADTVTLTGVNGTGVTATITNIGFALPGDRANNFTLTSSSNPNYVIVYDLNATAGSQTLVSSFDLVLCDKSGGKCTFGGGSVNNGIAPGTSATFTITGDFSGLTANQIARDIFARFQNVNPGGSDVAANNPNPVP